MLLSGGSAFVLKDMKFITMFVWDSVKQGILELEVIANSPVLMIKFWLMGFASAKLELTWLMGNALNALLTAVKLMANVCAMGQVKELIIANALPQPAHSTLIGIQ